MFSHEQESVRVLECVKIQPSGTMARKASWVKLSVFQKAGALQCRPDDKPLTVPSNKGMLRLEPEMRRAEKAVVEWHREGPE